MQRAELEAALDYAREGDALVVTKLDRLARSVAHLVSLGERLDAKGVSLKVLDRRSTHPHQPDDSCSICSALLLSWSVS